MPSHTVGPVHPILGKSIKSQVVMDADDPMSVTIIVIGRPLLLVATLRAATRNGSTTCPPSQLFWFGVL